MTLAELMIVMAIFVILSGVALTIYIAVLKSWSSQENRVGISIALDRAVNDITGNLRGAKEVGSVNNDEIRFTQDSTNYYIYYLYNSAETYPPSFNQTFYELRRATLTGGINGTFTYGSGRLILSDVDAPTTTDLSYSGGLATIDLTVTKNDQTMRSKTKVKARNL